MLQPLEKPFMGKASYKFSIGLMEVSLCVLIIGIAFFPLWNLSRGGNKSLIKSGEFMVTTAVLQNLSESYKVKPYSEIETGLLYYNPLGEISSRSDAAFSIRIVVEPGLMPNGFCSYKKIVLEVEKPGIIFATTLFKTALLRIEWVNEP